MVRALALAPVMLLALALAGCGTDEGSADDPAAAAPSSVDSTSSAAAGVASSTDAPACDEVWTAGATLPEGYRGCAEGDAFVEAAVLRCSSGQAIVRYDDRFWAVRGGTVDEADDIMKSKSYLKTVRRCRG